MFAGESFSEVGKKVIYRQKGITDARWTIELNDVWHHG